ncbi:MAG: alpha/beta hydrolase [Pseudomonadota bacterium]
MARARQPLATQLMRWAFRHAGPIVPGLFGGWAYRLWFSTRRFPEPAREKAWRTTARTDCVTWRDCPLIRYEWGDSLAPAVLLVHGWNGRGLQLGAFAAPLNAAGLRAVAFDAPAHGRTPGSSTNIFEFAAAIQAVAAASGTIAGVIGHSFGVPALARALQEGLSVPRLVAIAAPAHAEFLLKRFARQLDIPEPVIAEMRMRIERRFGMDIFLRLATAEMLNGKTLPGLIIHDRDDRDVPSRHAEQLHQAWPGSELLLTKGLGHTRILRDAGVIRATVAFLHHPA